MDGPLFSVLIPSWNCLELLRHAVDSVLAQDADFEIVVADNASDQPYGEYIQSLGAIAERSVRSGTPLSVTENWNRALTAATGRYFIMLGDDDALCPGWLARATELIKRFEEPQVLYAMAYHYAYPGVIEQKLNGYLASVNNSEVFRGSERPYLLAEKDAVILGEQALRFRHRFSFNSQHFIWSRRFVESLSRAGPFFQGPYPDYYAAIVTMLTAQTICVVPKPQVIIGISPKSFGFYYNNKEVDAGQTMLGNTNEHIPIELLSRDESTAMSFPGSSHYRNWLISTLLVARNLGLSRDRKVDFRRYRRLQLVEAFFGHDKFRLGAARRRTAFRPHLQAADLPLVRKLDWLERMLERSQTSSQSIVDQISKMSGIYTPALVTEYDIGSHSSIEDAFRWLANQMMPPPVETLHPLANGASGTTVAVVFLARSSDGSVENFRPFIDSYRSHEAGIPHELIILRKGLHGWAISQRQLALMLEDIPHRTIDVSDQGFDIQAYLKAAHCLLHDRICFLNTHSEINADNWLYKLNAPLNLDDVGISGATASYESLHTTLYLLSKAIWLTANKGIQYSPKIARQFRETLLATAPLWMSRRGSISRQIIRELARPVLGRPIDTPEMKEEFEEHWKTLTKLNGAFHAFKDFRPFPNPHLRSNAFMIRRQLLLDFAFELDNTKEAANRFESGPEGLPMRIAERDLKSILVGADGSNYDVNQWPKSRTFRLGDQSNTLVIDNHVRRFAKMSKWDKILHARITWGDFLPISASGFVDLGVKFERGSLDLHSQGRRSQVIL